MAPKKEIVPLPPVVNGESFILNVKSCDNSTWQGSVTWVDKGKNENFRSALELIRLIDSALAVKEKEKANNN